MGLPLVYKKNNGHRIGCEKCKEIQIKFFTTDHRVNGPWSGPRRHPVLSAPLRNSILLVGLSQLPTDKRVGRWSEKQESERVLLLLSITNDIPVSVVGYWRR